MNVINPLSDPSLQALASAPKQSVADIILQVGIAAMQVNDQKIELFYQQVNQNTIMMQNYNNAIAVANQYTNVNGTTGSVKFTYTDPVTGQQSQKEMYNFFVEQGLAIPGHPDAGWDKNSWSQAVETLKNASDTLGSTNQIDMMKLQSVIQKQNEMTQMVSDNMSKLSQISLAIISNMR